MSKKKIIVGYCINEKVVNITEEDAKKLTHLNIAAGTLRDGVPVLVSEEGVALIPKLRQYNPELKISVCFGGEFATPCLTDEGRQKIADGVAKIVEAYKLDGADLDWEYPCCGENNFDAYPEDRENFTLLCQSCRKALDGISGEHKLLTIAAGADAYFTVNTHMDQVQKELDYVYVMTYDLRGAFQTLTGHHSNLYTPQGDLFLVSADSAARLFNNAGVPKDKIAIGMAFYTRQWDGVPNRNHGYLQIAKTGGHYGPSYDELAEKYINKDGYVRYWDDISKAPWLFNGDSFISYDDEQSITCKGKYVLEEDYAGLFYWEHGSDKTGTLLDAAYKSLN